MIKVGLHLVCYPEIEPLWSYLPPLGLGYLAACVKQRLRGVEVFISRRLEDLLAQKPDLVGLTFASANSTYAARTARRIKEESGCPIVVGGPHVSTLKTVLDPAFDAAVLHEGEETFVELVDLLARAGRLEPGSMRKIKGLMFHENGGLVHTEPRPTIGDLDAIPYPDRDLMFDQYRRDRVELQIMTSRGCPYSCHFCSTVLHWGHGFRYPSNEYVLREIELIRNRYNPVILHVYDDLFVVSKARVMGLMKAMRERGLHEGLELRCFVHARLIDDELMESFARTNFKVLNIGFESGSDEVLNVLNKRPSNMSYNHRAIELARKHGVRMASCFIIGVPGEQRKDVVETFEFIGGSMDALQSCQFSPLSPLPGTQVFEWARKYGMSETNLAGVALEPEDINNEDHFYMNRYIYMNEENIPREEFLTYVKIGHRYEQMVWEHYKLTQRYARLEGQNEELRTAGYAARYVPIAEIVREKAKRRLRRLMPSNAEVRFGSA